MIKLSVWLMALWDRIETPFSWSEAEIISDMLGQRV